MTDAPRDRNGVPLVLANKLYAKLDKPEPPKLDKRTTYPLLGLDKEIYKKMMLKHFRVKPDGSIMADVETITGTITGRWSSRNPSFMTPISEKDDE